ncbi:histidine phosphatase family protein [Krasilnikovia sp. MM14-A1259]|uniref:histidine phosphatase family protein n=1 Tax=Krasilnikovia sp. MM14-A1259 TaxID=3373539 RepID=UPI0037FC9E00
MTYLLRRGRTSLSRSYTANGDPSRMVFLDDVGIEQCRRAAAEPSAARIATCVVSEFPRTRQTASLIVAESVPRMIDPRLNEISYGRFENGPWMTYGTWLRDHGADVAPPGGESRRAAAHRIMAGLRQQLAMPGPRLVVGHGLMISMILQLMRNGSLDDHDLPESPYVHALPLADHQLRELIAGGMSRDGGI